MKQLLNARFMSKIDDLTFFKGTMFLLVWKIHFLERNSILEYWVLIQGKVPAVGIYPVDRFATNNHGSDINNDNAYWLSTCYTQECSWRLQLWEWSLHWQSPQEPQMELSWPLPCWLSNGRNDTGQGREQNAQWGCDPDRESSSSAGRELSNAQRDLKIFRKNRHSREKDTVRFCFGEDDPLVMSLRSPTSSTKGNGHDCFPSCFPVTAESNVIHFFLLRWEQHFLHGKYEWTSSLYLSSLFHQWTCGGFITTSLYGEVHTFSLRIYLSLSPFQFFE